MTTGEEKTDFTRAQGLFKNGQFLEAGPIYCRILRTQRTDLAPILDLAACCVSLILLELGFELYLLAELLGARLASQKVMEATVENSGMLGEILGRRRSQAVRRSLYLRLGISSAVASHPSRKVLDVELLSTVALVAKSLEELSSQCAQRRLSSGRRKHNGL
jgi:hypothetical protein